MIKICPLRNVMCAWTVKVNKVFLVHFGLVLFGSSFCFAAASERQSLDECLGRGFMSQYYFIGVNDIAGVSLFFKGMPDVYFEADHFFVDKSGRQTIKETYFDDDRLGLLSTGQAVSLVEKLNLPMYRSGRELVFYSGRDEASVQQFEVKRYKKKRSPMDKHPLFGVMKRKDRATFIAMLRGYGDGDDSFGLSKKLVVTHSEIVYMITHFGRPYGTIILDEFNVGGFGIPNTSTLIKFELGEGVREGLSKEEFQYINFMFCRMSRDFQERFPKLEKLDRVGYAEYSSIARKMLPTREYFRNNPLVYLVGQILVLSFLGFLIICLMLGRYKKQYTYRRLDRVIRSSGNQRAADEE